MLRNVHETNKQTDWLQLSPSLSHLLHSCSTLFNAFARSSISLDDILFISSYHRVQFILPNAITALLVLCVQRKTRRCFIFSPNKAGLPPPPNDILIWGFGILNKEVSVHFSLKLERGFNNGKWSTSKRHALERGDRLTRSFQHAAFIFIPYWQLSAD